MGFLTIPSLISETKKTKIPGCVERTYPEKAHPCGDASSLVS
jgi:hypothetical protein